MSGFAEEEYEGADMSQQMMEEGVSQQMQNEEDEDVIDIDNPDELEAKGLKRIQIEGEEEEFLMDMEGNIYDLRGNFIGTTDGDGGDAGEGVNGGVDGGEASQIMIDGDEQFAEGDEY